MSETAEEVVTEEAPATPDYSKLLQKQQEKSANLERKLDAVLAQMANSTKPATAAQVDELAEIEAAVNGEWGAEADKYVPGLSKTLKAIAAKVKKSGGDDTSKVAELERRLAEREQFDDFMADKPAAFRKDYKAEVDRLRQEIADEGDEVTDRELRIAMKQFTKQWFKEQEEPEPESDKPATRKPVIPTGGGGRRKPDTVVTPQQAKERLQNPRPGQGNMLGITRADMQPR